MARIEEKSGPMVRATDWYSRRKYGREMEMAGVVGHSRPNMLAWGMLEWWHERAGAMDERLKALAATKVATRVGCPFCIDIGSSISRDEGVTEEQLRSFHDYRNSDAFSPEEKLVMEYAEEMTRTNVEVPDELFARLREHFDEEQIVELTMAIAIENFRSRFNNALDVAPAGFSEGAFCPMPERVQEEAAAARGSA